MNATYLSAEQVDDLEAVLNDAHRHELLAVVPSVHHERVDETLHDGALRLPEALGRVPTTAVREILGVLLLHGNIVL